MDVAISTILFGVIILVIVVILTHQGWTRESPTYLSYWTVYYSCDCMEGFVVCVCVCVRARTR
jgi:hypothetical protein